METPPQAAAHTTTGTALALPDPRTTTIERVAEVSKQAAVARAWCKENGDVEAAQELKRRLDAFTRYVADKHAREALEAELRRTEILIGELLGPRRQGERTDIASTSLPRKEVLNDRHVTEFRRLAENAPRVEELVQSGITKRSQILQRLEHDQRKNDPPPLTTLGRYPVLLADPPWRYEFAESKSRAIENQYPTMSLDEICALEPPAEDTAVLYLWATSPKLEEALRVLREWRFNYRTNLVWVKDRVGMGYWARQRHELLLVGVRGQWNAPLQELRPDSVIEAPRGEHSAKPDAAHEIIERCYPGVPKVEMFARRARDGWHAWGHEAQVAA